MRNFGPPRPPPFGGPTFQGPVFVLLVFLTKILFVVGPRDLKKPIWDAQSRFGQSWPQPLVLTALRNPMPPSTMGKEPVLFGHDRIWPKRIWPKPHLAKKSEFGQVIFVTAFSQTAFGQN